MSSTHQNPADPNEPASIFSNEFSGEASFTDLALDTFSGNVTDTSDFGSLGLDNLFPATNSIGDLWGTDPQWNNNVNLRANSAHATQTGSSTPELRPDSTSGQGARPPPKVGTRFSKEAVSILRQWLFAHETDPYPNDEEKDMLQNRTGLSKTQIANWLANARRRGMMQQPTRSAQKETASKPIEIPRRPGTPNPIDKGKQHLNPLERWFDSPPEDEPAAAAAIARALASRQSRDSSPRDIRSNQSESEHSPAHPSSTGTSRSGSSFSSVRSHSSRGPSRPSTGSRPSRIERSRYKKRPSQRRSNARSSLAIPLDRFQCTFCTETFRTKHDWQRHEKSIHLPLDRWICAPDGPRIINEQSGLAYCVFCGETDPDGPHIEGHNPSFCRERTFSRKDHLKQHLHLVHNAPLVDKLTRNWKIPPPQVQSRCGFCGIAMDTWEFRVDHLADHFKMGQTMAQWKGDWGFESDILKMVENSIPPYLIDSERRTPAPFAATNTPIESPRHAYELIQSELAWFLQTHDHNQGGAPNHDALQLEACRIIFAAEVMMMEENTTNAKPTSSWLRDLITSREDIAQQAQFSPIRSQAESALLVPKLYGKKTLFEECPLESQLHDFVRTQWALHQKILTDSELQVEACRLVSCICQELMVPADNTVATWLIMLISSSTGWLAGFRQRTYNPIASEPSSNLEVMNFTMQQPNGGLQNDLSLNTNSQASILQGSGGAFGAPLNNNAGNTHGQIHASLEHVWESMGDIQATSTQNSATGIQDVPSSDPPDTSNNRTTPGPDHRPPWVKTNLYFVTDANFHRWLARELGRWAAATMSPNNPNSHSPTDEELRHQARCILYDDDDPWNPTAADNAEWLRRFKSEFGIPM